MPEQSTFHAFQAWLRQASQARPFLRWAGGKWYALPQFAHLIPPFTGRYFEPMLGSGAVFFHLARARAGIMEAWLGDTNRQLIDCFAAVRDEPELLAERLHHIVQEYNDADDRASVYYRYREHYNATLPRPDPAVFLFLNRTCWNGLYRVNAAGEFNVPHGGSKPPSFPDLEDLLNASAALAQARLRNVDWRTLISQAREGDFIYFDPPYYSDFLNDSAKYSKSAFGLADHERLAHTLKRLSDRGVDFILSNSAEPQMVQIYERLGLIVQRIDVRRSISSDIRGRAIKAPELIVRPSFATVPLQLNLAGEDQEGAGPAAKVTELDVGAIRF